MRRENVIFPVVHIFLSDSNDEELWDKSTQYIVIVSSGLRYYFIMIMGGSLKLAIDGSFLF